MNEKIFFSDKDEKTIQELKALGEIFFPVFKNGKKIYKTSLDGLLDEVQSIVIIDTATTREDIINIVNAGKIPLFKKSQGQGSKYLYPAWIGNGPMTFGSIEKDYYWFATINMEGVWDTGHELINENNSNVVVFNYETVTYQNINEVTQAGKQVFIYYTGVDEDLFWTLSYKTSESSYVFTFIKDNSIIKMTLNSANEWSEEIIDFNAGGASIEDVIVDVTDPLYPTITTELESIQLEREIGGKNYATLISEKDTYGCLMPVPSLQGDINKVPVHKSGGQIEWEEVPSEGSVSAEIANAVETVKTNNIYTIPLGAIQKVITPTGSGTLYSYWTIISPTMDFPLSIETTLSFLVKQLGTCTKAYLAIYEIDTYNQKIKWVANTNDFHASLSLGYNYIKLAYISLSAKLSSSKLYYVAFISNSNSVQLAGNSLETQFNGLPRIASKIDNINTSFNAATLQSIYNEFDLSDGSEILDRLFINISNVEHIVDPVDPTPFTALTNTTVNNSNRVSAIAPTATTFGANGILYQKVIPNLDISISSVWILDYHSSQNANLPAFFILDSDLNTITSVNVPALTNAGTSEKIGNYYVHKYFFSTPITLQEGQHYWVPAIGNCSDGTSEWAIQYTAADPSIPIRDMLAVSDITNFSTADKVIVNNKNGCYLKIIDSASAESLI